MMGARLDRAIGMLFRRSAVSPGGLKHTTASRPGGIVLFPAGACDGWGKAEVEEKEPLWPASSTTTWDGAQLVSYWAGRYGAGEQLKRGCKGW